MKRDLSGLANATFDVIIIGGGIYGTCAAWEAVLRGLSVALIDRYDFGSKSSANSQKIIHGGFRYLQHADFIRMRESVVERTNLMRIAPHLIHPMAGLIPTYGHGIKSRELLFLGLKMYDLVGFDRNFLADPQKHIKPGYLISKEEVLKILPDIPKEKLTGGAVYFDAQAYNTERLTFGFIQSAVKRGVQAANYVEATQFIKEGNRVVGIQCRDTLSDQTFSIRGQMILNTTGPWAYKVLSKLNDQWAATKMPLVKCFNVITKKLFDHYSVGIYGRKKYHDKDALLDKGTRLFFVTPWRNQSIVGTAISYYDEDPDKFRVTYENIKNFLDDFNEAYPAAQLKPEDVTFLESGFLPSSGLDGKLNDVQIAKKYKIIDHRSEGIEGLISVVGVKYTTARDVCEKLLDRVFKVWGKKAPPSLSATTPIEGGKIERFSDFLNSEIKKAPLGLKEDALRPLIMNYGSRYSDILNLVDRNEAATAEAITKAEVLNAIRNEMALKLSDIILRRTELGTARHPGNGILRFCSQVMGQELGWSEKRIQDEVNEVDQFYTSWLKS